MALTMESVVAELDQLGDEPELHDVCRAVTHGSLMGARGNSGVILSQLLRGFADGLDGGTPTGSADGQDLARALVIADELARKAVMRPVEGTILTVATGAAEGASRAAAGGSVPPRGGRGGSRRRRRGLGPDPVPPACPRGGGGGRRRGSGIRAPLRRPSARSRRPAHARASRGHGGQRPGQSLRCRPPGRSGAGRGLSGPRYEVMYLLEAPDETIPSFKEVWAGLGRLHRRGGRGRPLELSHPH